MSSIYRIIRFLYQRPKYSTVGGKQLIIGKYVPSESQIKGIIRAYLISIIASLAFLFPLIFSLEYLIKTVTYYLLVILLANIILNLYIFKGRMFSLRQLYKYLKQVFIQTIFLFLTIVILGVVFLLFSYLPYIFQFNKYLLTFIFFAIYFNSFSEERGFKYFELILNNQLFLKNLNNSFLSSFIIILMFVIIALIIYSAEFLVGLPNITYFIVIAVFSFMFFFILWVYRDTVDFTNFKETLKLVYKTLAFGLSTTFILAVIYYMAIFVLQN